MLVLACVDCYILTIGHGSYMHMLADEVHVGNHTRVGYCLTVGESRYATI